MPDPIQIPSGGKQYNTCQDRRHIDSKEFHYDPCFERKRGPDDGCYASDASHNRCLHVQDILPIPNEYAIFRVNEKHDIAPSKRNETDEKYHKLWEKCDVDFKLPATDAPTVEPNAPHTPERIIRHGSSEVTALEVKSDTYSISSADAASENMHPIEARQQPLKSSISISSDESSIEFNKPQTQKDQAQHVFMTSSSSSSSSYYSDHLKGRTGVKRTKCNEETQGIREYFSDDSSFETSINLEIGSVDFTSDSSSWDD